MADLNNTSKNESYYTDLDLAISYPVRFWFFLFSDILSILCSFFVPYHVLSIRNFRRSLHNHTIVILLLINLIYELIDIPLILQYYRLNGVWQTTPILSQFWPFIDSGLYTTQLIVFAWSTIERHILIFHDRWLLGKRKLLFFHYFPLIILLLYCLIYYILIIFYPFCEYLNYQLVINGAYVPCIYLNPIFSQWDLISHQIIPTFLIIIFSMGLLVRVLWQKTRLRRSIQWRKQRKLTIQVLSISILYLLFQFPWTFFQFLNLVGVSADTTKNPLKYTYFLCYYVEFLFPFVCCGSLPGC